MTKIKRPNTKFTEKGHKYTVEGKNSVPISTISKVGQKDAFGVAAGWAFRLTYEGCLKLAQKVDLSRFTVAELREELKKRHLTPWSATSKAQKRGTWVHDMLEELALTGEFRKLDKVPKEWQGHARGVLNWYLDYRPQFEATEVMVASKLGFAGRYDIRCLIASDKLGAECDGGELCLVLVDLKTSKRVYPTEHFVQLIGYEIASVEMGFKPTDFQYVLNTHPDGTYEFVRSCAKEAHFKAYLAALLSMQEIEAHYKGR